MKQKPIHQFPNHLCNSNAAPAEKGRLKVNSEAIREEGKGEDREIEACDQFWILDRIRNQAKINCCVFRSHWNLRTVGVFVAVALAAMVGLVGFGIGFVEPSG